MNKLKDKINIIRIIRTYLHLIDTLSVVLIALLANFIFSANGNINFKSGIDWVFVGKLLLLTTSAFCFYNMVYRLKGIETTVDDEYRKNIRIDREKKYKEFFNGERKGIIKLFLISIICCVLFFFIEPTINWLWDK